MFPLIPVVAVLGILAGAGGLAWYEALSTEEKENADRLASEFAWNVYDSSVKNLTQAQADNVASMVRRHLGV